MPDLSHVGRRYLAPGQVVSAERVAAYASAVSGAGEVYSPGSVPPTFAAVYCLLPSLAEVLRDPELGIELAGGDQTQHVLAREPETVSCLLRREKLAFLRNRDRHSESLVE